MNRRVPSVFKAVIDPIQNFFRLEAASGILLVFNAVLALLWANSPWAESYHAIFHLPLSLGIADATFRFDVHAFINDGLMAIFFLVVGMEIKRELVVGELRTVSRALLPAVAALGGMIVPAGIYLLFNAGQPSKSGWAIPMATDIAFSIGVLTLVKARVANALVIFLTALAIFDDMGGILVIALFYGSGLHLIWLIAALGVTAGLIVFNRLQVSNGLIWTFGGLALWLCLHEGGIHATIAGVVLGMCIPAKAKRPPMEVIKDLHQHTERLCNDRPNEDVQAEEILQIEETLEDLEPPLNRYVHALHPYVAFFIVPLFALANSGVSLAGTSMADLGSRLPLGVMLGLFIGKPVGIFLFTMAAILFKLSPMPGNAPKFQLFGVSVVAGIGFTVAIFVATLAFANDEHLLDQSKLGILLGSFASAIVGYLLLRFAPMKPAKLPAPPARATVTKS